MDKSLKISLIAILCLVAIGSAGFYVKYRGIQEPLSSPAPYVSESKDQDEESTAEQVSGAGSYQYLFNSTGNGVSNVVGYFGGGAFAWYVPDWLIENWTMGDNEEGSMIFMPKVRSKNTFSDITFIVEPLDEAKNALAHYELELQAPNREFIIKEVLLNKHADGELALLVDTNTRIYHLQFKEGQRIYDHYFIDGEDKTVSISFSADENIFPQFSDKIRDMVEGVGELKLPQG